MTTALDTTRSGHAAPTASDRKTAHHARNVKLIMVSYVIDGLALLMFHLVGTIGWFTAVAYTGIGLAICGVTYWLIASGRTRGYQDPGIVIPQTIASQAHQLAAMALFPEVNFMFALLLFIVYSSLTLSAAVRDSLVAWIVVSIGTVVVLVAADTSIHIPNATLAEQLIAYGFFLVTLWRCMWLSTFNSGMTVLLKKRGRELADLTAQVDQLAHRDELTGVMNRRSLLEALRDELQRSQRTGQPLCVAMIDLDRFKAVNDRLGHLAGDRTLRIFASTLSAMTRRADRFGRYGGEEFLLVMTVTDATTAEVPIERMRSALKAADWRSVASDFSVTFSCGIAQLEPGETLESLLQRADDALYRAKADGRDCTRFA